MSLNATFQSINGGLFLKDTRDTWERRLKKNIFECFLVLLYFIIIVIKLRESAKRLYNNKRKNVQYLFCCLAAN